MAHILDSLTGTTVRQGWQCPSCLRVYAPHMVMCSYCPEKPEPRVNMTTAIRTLVNDPDAGHPAGTPCPAPLAGGLCGCEDGDDTGPGDCLRARCDC
jgi:hypothetical protein